MFELAPRALQRLQAAHVFATQGVGAVHSPALDGRAEIQQIAGSVVVARGDGSLRQIVQRSRPGRLIRMHHHRADGVTQITTNTLPGGQVGVSYSASVTASGGVSPYTAWIFTGLPVGVTMTGSSGSSATLGGTPSTPGTYSVSAAVTDSAGTKAASALSLVIAPAALVVTTASLPAITVGQPYTSPAPVATGGTAPILWSASGLPAGLSINPLTGVISGIATGQ
jgi:hypothetical protein